MRQIAREKDPSAPKKHLEDIHGNLSFGVDLNRPVCLPLLSQSGKLIWVNSHQIELELNGGDELEKAFDRFPYLTAEETTTLAHRCSLHPDQVKVWFMAKRLQYGISWECKDIDEVYSKFRARQEGSGREDSRKVKDGKANENRKKKNKQINKVLNSVKKTLGDKKVEKMRDVAIKKICKKMEQKEEREKPLKDKENENIKESKAHLSKKRKKKSRTDEKGEKKKINWSRADVTQTPKEESKFVTSEKASKETDKPPPPKRRKRPKRKILLGQRQLVAPMCPTFPLSLHLQTESFSSMSSSFNTETSDKLQAAVASPSFFTKSNLDGGEEVKTELENDSNIMTVNNILVTDLDQLKTLIKGDDSLDPCEEAKYSTRQDDDLESPSQLHYLTARGRKTSLQMSMLRMSFMNCQYPSSEEYQHLTEISGIHRSSLVQWFGDMRYAVKRAKPRWMTEAQHKKVLGNIMYKQCMNILTKI